MGRYWDKLIFTFVFIAVLVILQLMALPNWGQLQKALDNPETIEEAIVRLIAAHNEAPDSHLSEGQSLHNHSHEDVIDHPERSIPTDKYSISEAVVSLNLGSAASWTPTDIDVTSGASGLVFQNDASFLDDSIARTFFFNDSSLDYTPTFIIFDLNVTIYRSDSGDQTEFGIQNANGLGDYIHFNFEGDSVVGRFRENGSITTTSPLDIGYESDDTLLAHCRLIYDLSENTLTFYFNDQEIGSLTPSSDFDLPTGLYVDVTRNDETSSDSLLTIHNLYISAGNY